MSKGHSTDGVLPKGKTLYRTRGLAQDLVITRQGGRTTLWSASGVRHTVLDNAAPHIPGLEYARNSLAALAFFPQAHSCLVLGLGGGSIPRMLLTALPRIEIDAVEIDPAVVEVAARYFDMQTMPRFTVYVEDAAAYLGRCNSRYGIVVLDTYIGEQFPDQCASRDFLSDVRKCLHDDGVLVVNWLEGDAGTKKMLLMNLEGTIGPVWQLPGLKSRNMLLFTTVKQIMRPALVAAAVAVEEMLPFKTSLARLVQRLRAA